MKIERVHSDGKDEGGKAEIKRRETLVGQNKKHDYALKVVEEKRVERVNMDCAITLKQSLTKETDQTQQSSVWTMMGR